MNWQAHQGGPAHRDGLAFMQAQSRPTSSSSCIRGRSCCRTFHAMQRKAAAGPAAAGAEGPSSTLSVSQNRTFKACCERHTTTPMEWTRGTACERALPLHVRSTEGVSVFLTSNCKLIVGRCDTQCRARFALVLSLAALVLESRSGQLCDPARQRMKRSRRSKKQ